MKRLITLFAVAGLVLALAPAAQADATWDGGGDNINWSDNGESIGDGWGNWSADPTTGGDLTLPASSTSTVDTDTSSWGINTVTLGASGTLAGSGTLAPTVGYVSEGDANIAANLGGAAATYKPKSWGSYLTVLTGVNTFGGAILKDWQTIVRADEGAGLSPNCNLQIGYESSFETGVDLIRPGGTGQGEMQFLSVAYALGLVAVGGPVKVCFGTLLAPESLTWNVDPFKIDGNQGDDPQLRGLCLNATYNGSGASGAHATHSIELVNPIDLGTAATGYRRINAPSAFPAILSGVLSGSDVGIKKNGNGTLILSGANTYTGAVTVVAGKLEFTKAESLASGKLDIKSGAKVVLSYSGTRVISDLWLNEVQQAGEGAVYDVTTSPTYIEGGGSITVGVAPPPAGTVFVVK
jgi:autotransporter-associated beta strand protein